MLRASRSKSRPLRSLSRRPSLRRVDPRAWPLLPIWQRSSMARPPPPPHLEWSSWPPTPLSTRRSCSRCRRHHLHLHRLRRHRLHRHRHHRRRLRRRRLRRWSHPHRHRPRRPHRHAPMLSGTSAVANRTVVRRAALPVPRAPLITPGTVSADPPPLRPRHHQALRLHRHLRAAAPRGRPGHAPSSVGR